MALSERIKHLVKINSDSEVENPREILEQTISRMEKELFQLRELFDEAIAKQKRTRQLLDKYQLEAETWQRRARLALSKGNESLAREALIRKKAVNKTVAKLKIQLEQPIEQIRAMRDALAVLGRRIAKARAKKKKLFESQEILSVEKLISEALQVRLREIEARLLDQRVITERLLEQNSIALDEVRELLVVTRNQPVTQIPMFSNTQAFLDSPGSATIT